MKEIIFAGVGALALFGVVSSALESDGTDISHAKSGIGFTLGEKWVETRPEGKPVLKISGLLEMGFRSFICQAKICGTRAKIMVVTGAINLPSNLRGLASRRGFNLANVAREKMRAVLKRQAERGMGNVSVDQGEIRLAGITADRLTIAGQDKKGRPVFAVTDILFHRSGFVMLALQTDLDGENAAQRLLTEIEGTISAG